MVIVKVFEHISCKFISLPLFALVLYAAGVCAEDPGTSMFSFNGFGTLGVVHSSEDQADFISSGIKPNGAGYTHAWSLAVDSLIAGQVTANFTPKLSAFVQVIAEQKYNNTYMPHVEWANIKYQFTPDFSIRIGRTVLPGFLVSDYRKVGYVNPRVRPPVELYSLVPITTSDGVDVSYSLRIGEFSNTIQAIYGNSKVNLTAGSGGGTVKARDAWGVSYSGEYHAATVHITYHTTNLSVGFVKPLFDGFRQFGAEGIALADNYDPNNKSFTFIGIGGMYDPGTWFLTGEWGYSNSDSLLGERSAWYISGGYRFGALTPYLTYAQRKVHSSTSDPGLTLSIFPPYIAGTAAGLNAGLNASLGSQPVQQTISVGVRWDFMKNVAFKLQFDHTDIGTGSPGTLINIQPGFQPGGAFNVFSATIDFVF